MAVAVAAGAGLQHLHAAIELASTVSLQGEWRFALDRDDVGAKEEWFNRELEDRIQLPGILQAQGYGDEISIHTPWVLSLYDKYWYLRADYQAYTNEGNVKVPFLCQPRRHYVGVAWYQRDVEIPEDWQDRRVELFLERTRWESSVWVDDQRIGSYSSLVAPHKYDLGVLTPGKHQLTIRADSGMLMDYRPDAHAVSDSLGSTWNGIVGRIELRSTTPVWLQDVQVFPDVASKLVRVKGKIGNSTGVSGSGSVTVLGAFDAFSVGGAVLPLTPALSPEEREAESSRRDRFETPRNDPARETVLPLPEGEGRGEGKGDVRNSINVSWSETGGSFEAEVLLGQEARLWDEFSRNLHRLTFALKGEGVDDRRVVTFGLREFKAEGREFVINGRPTNLRGTHHGGDFPLTGYPPCDPEYWLNLFRTCREWGLNHVRFHSFCPPEAAFDAADVIGIYLQPECGMWNTISPGTEMERMMYLETERMIEAYGNHPSFVLFSPSNEPKGHWMESMSKWAEHFREVDPRRLYTTGTGHTEREVQNPTQGSDYLAVQRLGPRMLRRERGWFGRDFESSLEGVNIPVIAHEIGQWCAYPDYDVIKKFTGFIQPGNFEIFRDSLAAHGMLDRDEAFAWASGRFQLECYKEEVEANLRTRGLGGFQLLDLHDYTGQGTALVGLLDPFWELKSYVTAKEWRQFCNTTVPLARLRERVFTTADKFDVPVEVAHYGPAPIEDAISTWRIVDISGKVVTKGELPAKTIPLGKGTSLGDVVVDLSKLVAPGAYELVVEVGQTSDRSGQKEENHTAVTNSWKFWLYPDTVPDAIPAGVLVTRSWDEAELGLAEGGRVLFMPRTADLDWGSPPLDDVPVFWNRLMNPNWSRMLGIWCETNHPALAEFPTEAYCDWQWTGILRGTRAMNLDHFPRTLQPIVQAIDDWNRNWKLGVVSECKVGPGRLMICTVDLERDLDQRPVARQLRRSLLDYMEGSQFEPTTEIAAVEMRRALFDSRIMKELGASVGAEGANPSAVIDGDPNTYWLAGSRGRRELPIPHPHELTITFPEPVPVNGLIFMPRQNDRNHQGDIREFKFEVSENGADWRTLVESELASTYNPQILKFNEIVTARRIRLTALSGFGDDPTAALAELAILYAGKSPVAAESGPVEYRRVRSTSIDVDEGN